MFNSKLRETLKKTKNDYGYKNSVRLLAFVSVLRVRKIVLRFLSRYHILSPLSPTPPPRAALPIHSTEFCVTHRTTQFLIE